jgi:hypothetical protein
VPELSWIVGEFVWTPAAVTAARSVVHDEVPLASGDAHEPAPSPKPVTTKVVAGAASAGDAVHRNKPTNTPVPNLTAHLMEGD